MLIYSYYFWLFACSCNGPFIDSLKRYIENDAVKDAATAAEEGTDMKHLKCLLEEAARDLDRFEPVVTSASSVY
jgi:hypothetical protein